AGAGLDFLPLERFDRRAHGWIIPEDFGPDDAGVFFDLSACADPKRADQGGAFVDVALLIRPDFAFALALGDAGDGGVGVRPALHEGAHEGHHFDILGAVEDAAVDGSDA